MNTKLIAIAAVIAVVIAGTATYVVLSDDDDEDKKGGLYDLDATILNVDMGGMSSTPNVIDTLQYMYSEVYGDLYEGADALTLADAKADTDFWSKYCDYTSIVTVNSDNSITYKTILDSASTQHDITISSPATKLIATGTAYPTNIYHALCVKYGVEPFSDEAFANNDLVSEFQFINYGGLVLSSIKTSSEELAKYYSSDYVESCTSIKNYDTEKLATDVKNAGSDGSIVMVMGSGSINKANNASVAEIVENQGGYIAYNNATSIKSTMAGIELTCTIFGYSDEAKTIIEDMQLDIYKIYWSVQKQNESHKAYFEGSSGSASKNTGSGAELCTFLGFDISLFTGSQVDTETLLSEKPDVLIYYTNDDRSMDEKMRVTS